MLRVSVSGQERSSRRVFELPGATPNQVFDRLNEIEADLRTRLSQNNLNGLTPADALIEHGFIEKTDYVDDTPYYGEFPCCFDTVIEIWRIELLFQKPFSFERPDYSFREHNVPKPRSDCHTLKTVNIDRPKHMRSSRRHL